MPWTTKYERISQSRKAWTRDFTKRLVTFNKSDSMEKKGGKIYGKIEPKPKEFRSEIEIIFSVKSKLSTSVKFVTWHLGLALIIRLWTWSILNNIIVVYLSRQPNKQVTSCRISSPQFDLHATNNFQQCCSFGSSHKPFSFVTIFPNVDGLTFTRDYVDNIAEDSVSLALMTFFIQP